MSGLIGLIYTTIAYPLIYIFPAYAANGAPVIFGGGAPLDFNKKIFGKRIFGDHKTIKGTLSALIAGIAAGIIETFIFQMPYLFLISVLLTLGAIAGDLIGSLIKRRIDLKSGHSSPIIDQYGFFIFALLLAFPLDNLPTIYGLIFLVILTGLLHPLTNLGANKLKLKEVPW